MICKRCGKQYKDNSIKMLLNNEEKKLCRKCLMMGRTDLDRTGRHSKKDKNRDKQERLRDL